MSATAYPPNGAPHYEAAVAVRRFVNDEIARVATQFDGNDGGVFEFVCECGDLTCHELTKLTLAEYGFRARGSVLAH